MIYDRGTREALTAMLEAMCLPPERKQTNVNEVWVVEGWRGGEDRTVFGVYANSERAIEHLKEQHPSPYVIKWHEAFRDENHVSIIGDFDYVPQLSVRHSEEFTITKWKIDG